MGMHIIAEPLAPASQLMLPYMLSLVLLCYYSVMKCYLWGKSKISNFFQVINILRTKFVCGFMEQRKDIQQPSIPVLAL